MNRWKHGSPIWTHNPKQTIIWERHIAHGSMLHPQRVICGREKKATNIRLEKTAVPTAPVLSGTSSPTALPRAADKISLKPENGCRIPTDSILRDFPEEVGAIAKAADGTTFLHSTMSIIMSSVPNRKCSAVVCCKRATLSGAWILLLEKDLMDLEMPHPFTTSVFTWVTEKVMYGGSPDRSTAMEMPLVRSTASIRSTEKQKAIPM